jgi:large subunit ribosomal protein L21
MKKAIIATGGKQHLVTEGDILEVELITADDNKQVTFEPLLLISDDTVSVGQPTVKGANVTAEVLESNKQAPKVSAIRYKAKKRVHKVRGHRQHQTVLKITKIA